LPSYLVKLMLFCIKNAEYSVIKCFLSGFQRFTQVEASFFDFETNYLLRHTTSPLLVICIHIRVQGKEY